MLTYSGMRIEAGRLRLRVKLCSSNVQLLCAGGGKGRPPPCAFWTICVGRLRGVNCAREDIVAYAAGGRGRPRPRHSRPGTASLGSL